MGFFTARPPSAPHPFSPASRAAGSGRVYADDSPEAPNVKLGIIALTDCSPIVIAHEKGFFKKYGINSTISKEASWAVIRDKLVTGENQATHMLIGMPIAATMGLGGQPKKEMVIPWLLNRNGQAITLKQRHSKGKSHPIPKRSSRSRTRRRSPARR